MTVNPYNAPSPLPDDLASVSDRSRPVGITILTGLHAIGALLFSALLVFLATRFGEITTDSIIGWAVLIVGPPCALLAIATPIGLWRGHRWAWWLATFYYFQFVVGGACVLAIMAIATVFFDRSVTERTVELFAKHVSRILVFSLLTWYMTRQNVIAFFGFERLTRVRALCMCGGVIFLMAALLCLLMLVAWRMGLRLD